MLQERANKLKAEGAFLGGPVEVFETAGRKVLITLLSVGLSPESRVLDIGYGCLRCGYWLIHFLDKGCYFGIEPNIDMLNTGRKYILEPQLEEIKNPSYDSNSVFDFTVFNEKFDFFIARSIWTHASKQQIKIMLDGFVSTANAGGIFITSYIRAIPLLNDYKGANWVGKSHESNTRGVVRHNLGWIKTVCAERGLIVNEIKGEAYNFGHQTWLRIKRKPTVTN